jgi:hypothetical protein
MEATDKDFNVLQRDGTYSCSWNYSESMDENFGPLGTKIYCKMEDDSKVGTVKDLK